MGGIMETDSMLAAGCGLAGLLQLAWWRAQPVRIARAWFALAAGCAALLALALPGMGAWRDLLQSTLLAAVAWQAASPLREGRARAVAVAATTACAGAVFASFLAAEADGMERLHALLLWTACALTFALTLQRIRHAWPARPVRSLANAWLACVPVLVAWAASSAQRTDMATPWIVLVVALAATIDLVDGGLRRIRAQERPRDFAHISRLAVVGELTAAIAHEINQPLGAILSNADAGEMLLDRIARAPDAHGLDELRHILADIRRDALRASGVIRHVRTLAGRRELTFDQIDANALATDTVRLLESDMRRRRIAVEVAPLEDAALLRGDRAYLEQVLINLLLNAMDAVEAQAGNGVPPSITLGVARTGHGAIEFRVVDQGQGIPTERLHKLFHSFYSSKPHGMGLGLSIARSIVEAHGGWIRAENNPGPGATFRVTFPPYAESDA